MPEPQQSDLLCQETGSSTRRTQTTSRAIVLAWSQPGVGHHASACVLNELGATKL